MTAEEKWGIVHEKEAAIAAEYPLIAEAHPRCPFGGWCASCMHRIDKAHYGSGLYDFEYTERDYCGAKY